MKTTKELWAEHVDRCNRITDRDIEENEILRKSPLAERWAYLDKIDAERRAILKSTRETP